MKRFQKYNTQLARFFASKQFFWATVIILLFSSVWLVFSARYPMAFDENYHYGIIQQYAKQWSPFFENAPAGSESLGDITRYPSYLFHYLMSFPYRFISLFTDSDSAKIILLRIPNVFMLLSSLFLFRRLFEKLKISPAIGNLSLFVFALIPNTPFLAAHISYDNVTIPLTALTLLLMVKLIESLRSGKLPLNVFVQFLCLGVLSSLVKYTYLPIFVAAFCYVLITYLYYRKPKNIAIFSAVRSQFTAYAMHKKILVVFAIVICAGLGFERYGVNMVKYQRPAPDCGQILSVESCRQYGPWGRDYRLKQRRKGDDPGWPVSAYTSRWIRTTLHEFFFAINYNYVNHKPLVVLYWFALAVLAGGVVAAILFARRIWRNQTLRLFAVLSLAYVAAVWIDNYGKFLEVHWPVAIHGRYLLPLVPIMAVVFGYSYKWLFEAVFRRSHLRVKNLLAAACVVVMLLGGGGTLTYIIRSDQTWYWNNRAVITTNLFISDLLKPVLK
jgi:hypothetical protein